jgi:hypothetical protein
MGGRTGERGCAHRGPQGTQHGSVQRRDRLSRAAAAPAAQVLPTHIGHCPSAGTPAARHCPCQGTPLETLERSSDLIASGTRGAQQKPSMAAVPPAAHTLPSTSAHPIPSCVLFITGGAPSPALQALRCSAPGRAPAATFAAVTRASQFCNRLPSSIASHPCWLAHGIIKCHINCQRAGCRVQAPSLAEVGY